MEKTPEKPDARDQQPGVAPLLLDAKAVATILSVSRSTLYRMSNTGQLGPMPITLGRRKLWRHEEILAWVRAGCPRRELWLRMAQDQGFGHQHGQRFRTLWSGGPGVWGEAVGKCFPGETGLTATTLLCKSAHIY